ncbi:putative signal transducing protein [Zhongshania sp.]|uniref:putative signal transducing protein n=1 Tax=Zhongshania sp. TaxID=1971902 RepID=UPI0039E452BA
MKKIFTDQNLMMVVHVQNLLATAGVSAELRNVYAGGASGSLAFTDVWPELWIDAQSVARADVVLIQMRSQSESVWTCSACDEENASSFDYCWQCGEASPEIVSE